MVKPTGQLTRRLLCQLLHQLLQCLLLRWGHGELCAALLLASFIMLDSMPILVSQFWSPMQLAQPVIIN